MLDERNVDIQLISPRPVAMMHWERTYLVEAWTEITNKVIFDQTKMFPERFVGVGQLPQSPEMNIKGCVKTLQKCVTDYKFVGVLLNPDPGGDRQALRCADDEAWFPLYKKAEELQATLVVHPSISRDPRLDRIPHSYQYNNVTEETLATLLLENSDVFQRFPKLKILICHCGGCLRRLMEAGEIVDHTAAFARRRQCRRSQRRGAAAARRPIKVPWSRSRRLRKSRSQRRTCSSDTCS